MKLNLGGWHKDVSLEDVTELQRNVFKSNLSHIDYIVLDAILALAKREIEEQAAEGK